jgi:hypothetical protein
LGFCHFASFSGDVVFGLRAFELVVVGMGGFDVGCLLCRHSLGSHCMIGDRFDILLSLIAAFCMVVYK